jgi:hypothetical protein
MLQCSVGQADLAVGGDVRPFVLGPAAHVLRLERRQCDVQPVVQRVGDVDSDVPDPRYFTRGHRAITWRGA